MVDSREPEEIYKMIAREAETKRASIDIADYIVMNNDVAVAIERKEAKDFVSSIEDGRIFNQAFLLSSLFDISFIVVEGPPSMALFDTRFPRRAYLGALSSLVLKTSPYGRRGRIGIVCVDSYHDTAQFIVLLHKQLQEGKLHRLPRLVVKNKREIDIKMASIMALQAVPGIGPEVAYRLVERFGNLYNVLRASLGEIASVEGVGPERARRIKFYLGAL